MRLPILFVLLALCGAHAAPLDALSWQERKLHVEALRTSMTDDVGKGYCGRGVYSVLTSIGLLEEGASANGQDWEYLLWQAGWKYVNCASPEKAPWGSILVYWSDVRLRGKNFRGTAGGTFGHVEFVAMDASGRRWYVSDKPRLAAGGTVRDNFTGRAWLSPESYARLMQARTQKPVPTQLTLREPAER